MQLCFYNLYGILKCGYFLTVTELNLTKLKISTKFGVFSQKMFILRYAANFFNALAIMNKLDFAVFIDNYFTLNLSFIIGDIWSIL